MKPAERRHDRLSALGAAFSRRDPERAKQWIGAMFEVEAETKATRRGEPTPAKSAVRKLYALTPPDIRRALFGPFSWRYHVDSALSFICRTLNRFGIEGTKSK